MCKERQKKREKQIQKFTVTYSIIVSNENGSYAYPSPSKNLDMASTQCKRNACNIAEVPSMKTKIHMVKTNHIPNRKTTFITAKGDPESLELNAFDTVSYTHLDVYKRQASIHPALRPRLVL